MFAGRHLTCRVPAIEAGSDGTRARRGILAKKNARGAGGRKAAAGGGGGRGFYFAIAAVVVVGLVAILMARDSEEKTATSVLSVAETTAVEADPAAGTAIGPMEAPVVIMEFADFLCPHCRNFNAMTGRLLRQNHTGPGGPLRWVSYEFPLWPESVLPALAVRCAEEQGKYWEMHDLLFARVDSWRDESSPARKFAGYARDLGLDGRSFETCLDEQRYIGELMASRKYGEQLGVSGTPTLFFNGRRLEAASENYSYEGLERQILAAADEPAEPE
jgi:protein-disulfide isomerase